MEGDCGSLNLGISSDNREVLCENVTMIYHFAAITSLNATYKKAVEVNLRGTREMINLAANCKNLQFFCYVSTAMCNLSGKSLEEETLSPSLDPHMSIKIAEILSEDSVEKVLSQFNLGGNVCSYSFTKQMAEALIAEAQEKLNLPIVICRPVLLTPTYMNPVAGWLNHSNYILRIERACLYGMIKTINFPESAHCPVIPADYAINNIMVCTWKYLSSAASHVEVLNFDYYDVEFGINLEKIRLLLLDHHEYSRGFMVQSMAPKCLKNSFLHWLHVFFHQWIPAVILDFSLICIGRKPL